MTEPSAVTVAPVNLLPAFVLGKLTGATALGSVEFRACLLRSNSLSNAVIRRVVDFFVTIPDIVNDAFTCFDAAHEFRKVRIIIFQSVTDESSCVGVNGPVFDERLCSTSNSIADCFVCS